MTHTFKKIAGSDSKFKHCGHTQMGLSKGVWIWLSLLLCCLSFFIGIKQVEGQALDKGFIENVRVTSPESQNVFRDKDTDTQVLPGTVEAPIGKALWAFYGCVTCHDFPIESSEIIYRGPDLDRVGEKTTSVWLARWLANPAQVHPNTPMPRVILSKDETASIIALLTTQKIAPVPAVDRRGDPDAGRDLFEVSQCSSCHKWGNKGVDVGPALDGVGDKIRRAWLIAYLLNPNAMQANARMPNYEFTQSQAEDLAAFMLQGGTADAVARPVVDDADVQAGLSVFVQRGCAACHAIEAYHRPIALPQASTKTFVAYHTVSHRESPQLSLKQSQIDAMANALVDHQKGQPVDADTFLRTFWQTPIAYQGQAPAAYDSAAVVMHPESCGQCHQQQWSDWQTTIHSKSMGPGVLGQFLDESESNPQFVESCQVCHAPASEQYPTLLDKKNNYVNNPNYDTELQRKGLTCMVCHVRNHVRYGPPRGRRATTQVWRGPGHGGGLPTPAFESAKFCRGCHQFEPGDMSLNGKLLQNTYNEWRESPQAAQGSTCQTCHMPNGRHLFRGIHDPETVRKALNLEIVPVRSSIDSIAMEIHLTNTGTGHHLPTYVTPMIFVRGKLLNIHSQTLSNTEEKRAIGREVILDASEHREVFDTRIPAGGQWIWRYAAKKQDDAQFFDLHIEVHPDYFYRRFFEAYSREGLSPAAAAMIDAAEVHDQNSPYVLIEYRQALQTLEFKIEKD